MTVGINYVSGLSTRAKVGLAATALVLAGGFVADYVRNSEVPRALVNGRSFEAYNKEIENAFPEAGRKERLEAQKQKLNLDWMSD